MQAGKFFRKAGDEDGTLYMFWCPGCEELHTVTVGGDDRPKWTFNGNLEKPTFQPSIFLRTGHYVVNHKPGDPCWCTYEKQTGVKSKFVCHQCHSFVTDGRIQFLPDSSHKLAGQTIDLPELPERYRD